MFPANKDSTEQEETHSNKLCQGTGLLHAPVELHAQSKLKLPHDFNLWLGFNQVIQI